MLVCDINVEAGQRVASSSESLAFHAMDVSKSVGLGLVGSCSLILSDRRRLSVVPLVAMLAAPACEQRGAAEMSADAPDP